MDAGGTNCALPMMPPRRSRFRPVRTSRRPRKMRLKPRIGINRPRRQLPRQPAGALTAAPSQPSASAARCCATPAAAAGRHRGCPAMCRLRHRRPPPQRSRSPRNRPSRNRRSNCPPATMPNRCVPRTVENSNRQPDNADAAADQPRPLYSVMVRHDPKTTAPTPAAPAVRSGARAVRRAACHRRRHVSATIAPPSASGQSPAEHGRHRNAGRSGKSGRRPGRRRFAGHFVRYAHRWRLADHAVECAQPGR